MAFQKQILQRDNVVMTEMINWITHLKIVCCFKDLLADQGRLQAVAWLRTMWGGEGLFSRESHQWIPENAGSMIPGSIISIILIIFIYVCITLHRLWNIFTNIVATLTSIQRAGYERAKPYLHSRSRSRSGVSWLHKGTRLGSGRVAPEPRTSNSKSILTALHTVSPEYHS